MGSIVTRPAFAMLVATVVCACGAATPSPSTVPLPAATSTPTATQTPASPSTRATPSASAALKVDGQIVFEDAGENFEHSQIWIENADGSNVRKLVSDDFTDNSPALSPDGTTVVFNRNGRITLVNVDGSDLHEVPAAPGQQSCGDEIEGDAFSPDGRRIVFTRVCIRAATFGIWTMNLDGTDPREVTRDEASPEAMARWLKGGRGWDIEDHRASWSPDGKWLVFERIDTTTAPERSAIFTVGVDGKGLRQVTPWELDANDAVWAPDGSLIAFNSPAEPSAEQNIYTIRPDGSGIVKLTAYAEPGQATFHPSWSPDAMQILFSHSPSTDGWGDLYVMNRDGSDPHILAATALHENHAYWGRSPAP